VLLTLAVGQFLAVGSASIVSVALPTIARDLGATGEQQQSIVDAYVLVFASLLVAGGVLGDRRGRKGAFVAGLVLFALGSALCAAAPTTSWLLAGRVVQGLGPPLFTPASLAVITAIYGDPTARARAIGLWSTASGLGLALGAVIGGGLVDAVGWRAVFGVNVPVCVALIAVAARSLPRIAPEPARRGFDVLGAILTTGGVGALTFGIIEGNRLGWGSAPILCAFVLGAGALAASVGWERHREEPLVDVGLFRVPAFVAANAAGLVVFFALIGAAVYFSAYFQQVQGRGPVEAGLCVLPLGAGVALGAPVAGRLTGRLGARTPMGLGLGLACVAMLGLLRLEPGTQEWEIWWDFLVLGLGAGLALPPMTATAVGAVRPARAGMASAVHNALRQVGQALGVAVLGFMLALVLVPRTGSEAP
jgi:DHA2 family methylenomycin A resistance protein-like MFS transporter